VYLDLKEAAQDGMGPHGMIVGATGSGKSELLRTLVLGLAATHSSETLNFVLVDFKGGATFASLERLPHTSAVITNLADELPLVDRMHDALTGELIRRQELLRRAGNFASLRDYNRARASGAPLPPLPSLLLVCDEFTEMLTAKPEFIDIFLQIGRIGRSSASTCCWPPSVWRKGGCAAWTPTCPTASPCGPSALWSRARSSAVPRRPACRRPRVTATSP